MKVEKFSETDSISIKTSTYDIEWEINNTKHTKSKTLRAEAKWTAISRGGDHHANLTKAAKEALQHAEDALSTDIEGIPLESLSGAA